MKKTIITLLALCGVAVAEDVSITLHGVVFSTPTTLGRFHNNSNYATSNYLIDGNAYGNLGNSPDVGGLYITDGSQFRTNGSYGNISVNYLYLEADDATIVHNLANNVTGTIGWANNVPDTKVVIKNGGWVDINNAFSRIDVSQMTTSGSIYLNTNGSLTLNSIIDSDVTVYATITENAVERTLVSGDYEGWDGSVVLQDINGNIYNGGNFSWEATSEGLKIVAVPEPTTATLSLLALAGLAARRRRK